MSSMRSSACAGLLAAAIFCLPNSVNAQGSIGPSTTVAKQGDNIVTLADIDAFAARMPENERPGFFDSPKRLESVILNLLVQKQLAADARAAGLDKDPGVQNQIALATDDVLGKVELQHFKDNIKVPDFNALAREDYIGHKDKYLIPETLNVKHVLISTKSRSEDEAKALAATVEKEAKAKPDQFDALIEKYSDDPSKEKNQGLMKDAGSTKYVPEFSQASKALKRPGDISPVVKTEYGFHVIRLVDRTDARQRSFEEARPEILQRLRSEFVDKTMRNHTDTMRNRPLDANAALVESLRTRYGAVPTPAQAEEKAAAGGK